MSTKLYGRSTKSRWKQHNLISQKNMPNWAGRFSKSTEVVASNRNGLPAKKELGKAMIPWSLVLYHQCKSQESHTSLFRQASMWKLLLASHKPPARIYKNHRIIKHHITVFFFSWKQQRSICSKLAAGASSALQKTLEQLVLIKWILKIAAWNYHVVGSYYLNWSL